MKPWHDTVLHTCDDGTPGPVVPWSESGPWLCPPDRIRHVKCAACGAMWTEESDAKLAIVWWSSGAYEGMEAKDG